MHPRDTENGAAEGTPRAGPQAAHRGGPAVPEPWAQPPARGDTAVSCIPGSRNRFSMGWPWTRAPVSGSHGSLPPPPLLQAPLWTWWKWRATTLTQTRGRPPAQPSSMSATSRRPAARAGSTWWAPAPASPTHWPCSATNPPQVRARREGDRGGPQAKGPQGPPVPPNTAWGAVRPRGQRTVGDRCPLQGHSPISVCGGCIPRTGGARWVGTGSRRPCQRMGGRAEGAGTPGVHQSHLPF